MLLPTPENDDKTVKSDRITEFCILTSSVAICNFANKKHDKEAHGKTPAQVILRWHIQEGLSAIPGASNPEYINENIGIFDFELSQDEMKVMRSLNKEKRFFNATLPQVEEMMKNYPLAN